MSLAIYVNKSSVDSSRAVAPTNFTLMDLVEDKLIFSAGSVGIVADGFPIPTAPQLNSAALLILAADVEVPHFFLADDDADLLREIFLAGNKTQRYVFCAAFSAATATEPVLEIWDDSTLQTAIDYCLGSGVANNSFFRGAATTSGAAAPTIRLAGSSDNHFLNLNNGLGALTVPTDLYFNLRITVPGGCLNAASETPVFCIRYTTN